MADASWWLSPTEEPRLSQGDVITQAAFVSALRPPTYLVQSSIKGHGLLWVEDSKCKEDKSGFFRCLGRGRIAAALVLTHSCQLDKPERGGKVVLAPVRSASHLSDNRDDVMAGSKIAFAPLPEVPELGDCYADLRAMMSLDRETVDTYVRLAAMNERPRMALHERLAGFFTREFGDPGHRRPAAPAL
ncbi:MAG: hypothetical protein WCG85_08635 [Polyangia bacterium]